MTSEAGKVWCPDGVTGVNVGFWGERKEGPSGACVPEGLFCFEQKGGAVPKTTIQHPSTPLNSLGHFKGSRWPCVISCALVCFLFGLEGCAAPPGKARDQNVFISEEKEIALGEAAWREVLKDSRLSSDPELTLMVNRVGRRIAAVADKPEYHWEFVLIEADDQINSFSLPGGKVAVYTGILKYTQDEAGLATVMAPLIAHVLLRHGAERYSRAILEQIGQIGYAAPLQISPAAADMSFTREQEAEAAYMGLELMAKAGYDPREAVAFYKRTAGVPAFSQHSTPQQIKQMEAWIPKAMKYYHPTPPPSIQ